MLLASIIAVCPNAYKGSLKLNHINMYSLRPSVMPQSISLTSVNMVKSGFGVTNPSGTAGNYIADDLCMLQILLRILIFQKGLYKGHSFFVFFSSVNL